MAFAQRKLFDFVKVYLHATICRREIVKQIGACKWRPDARAISVRHVGRFGKSLWSIHRFSRVGADFTAQAYVSLRKVVDVESKPARKKRSFDEKEINLLISQWSEYPCLFDKTNPDHKDENKRDIAGQQLEIAESLNEALD